MPEPPSGLSDQTGPLNDAQSPEAEPMGGLVQWFGSLFLALAPFALFAALLALDGLLRR